MNLKFSTIFAVIILAVAIVLLILLPRISSTGPTLVAQVPVFQLANTDPLDPSAILPVTPPPPPTCDPIGPVLNLRSNNVEIEWNAPATGTVDFYRVILTGGSGIIGNPQIDTSNTFVPIDDFVIGQGDFTVTVTAFNDCGDESTPEAIVFSICIPDCANGQTCIGGNTCSCSTPEVTEVRLTGTWQNGFTAQIDVSPSDLNFANMQWEIATNVRGTDGQLTGSYFAPSIVAGILGGSGNTLSYPININQPTCESGTQYGCPADGCPSDHGVEIEMAIRPINNCGFTQVSGSTYSCRISNYCELGGNSATPLVIPPII